MPKEQDFRKQVRLVYHYLLLTFVSVVLIIFGVIYMTTKPDISYTSPETIEPVITALDAEIVKGIHVPTGFVEGDGLPLVIQNCTNCQVAKVGSPLYVGCRKLKIYGIWVKMKPLLLII